MYFNSQPHEEADLMGLEWCLLKRYFNSQPHEEADYYGTGCGQVLNISTHSLTKRLTSYLKYTIRFQTFQLTASRRGWQSITNILILHSSFQLTASRRGWLSFYRRAKKALQFQLTASRRGWRIIENYYLLKKVFQLTASRRGWRQF